MTKINELIKFLSIKLNVNEIKCEANLGGQQSKIVEKLEISQVLIIWMQNVIDEFVV